MKVTTETATFHQKGSPTIRNRASDSPAARPPQASERTGIASRRRWARNMANTSGGIWRTGGPPAGGPAPAGCPGGGSEAGPRIWGLALAAMPPRPRLVSYLLEGKLAVLEQRYQ